MTNIGKPYPIHADSLIFMKKFLLRFSVFILSLSATAQWSENNALYYAMDFNTGNYSGLDLSANYIYKEKYSFKLGYNINLRPPKSEPEDFKLGVQDLLTIGLLGPYDHMEQFYMGAGRVIPLNPKGSIRANLTLGIAITSIKEPTNWKKNPMFLDRNYTYQYHKYHTISLIINPKIEFPFTRIYGLSLSPSIHINKDRTYFGIGIGQLLGVLKKRDRPKDSTE